MVREAYCAEWDGYVLVQTIQRAAFDVYCGKVSEGGVDEVLDCRPEFIGDKDIAQFKYEDRVWDTDNGFHEWKELAVPDLSDVN